MKAIYAHKWWAFNIPVLQRRIRLRTNEFVLCMRPPLLDIPVVYSRFHNFLVEPEISKRDELQNQRSLDVRQAFRESYSFLFSFLLFGRSAVLWEGHSRPGNALRKRVMSWDAQHPHGFVLQGGRLVVSWHAHRGIWPIHDHDQEPHLGNRTQASGGPTGRKVKRLHARHIEEPKRDGPKNGTCSARRRDLTPSGSMHANDDVLAQAIAPNHAAYEGWFNSAPRA